MTAVYGHTEKFYKDGLTCPYCKIAAEWVPNEEVYGKRYGKSYMCWWCRKCGAYVGCHENTRKPLGSMANKELRNWRMKAHSVIDPIWKSKKMKRNQVYKLLSQTLKKEVHIGWSDINECKEIIKVAQERLTY